MPDTHARFSPSAANRRIHCPPSLLLEEQFEEDDPAFLHFLDCYSGDRNDDKFRELIDKAYTTIQSLPEPEQWLHEKVEMLRDAQIDADDEPESDAEDDGDLNDLDN